MSEKKQRYQQREKNKGTDMGDRDEDAAKAAFKRSKEFHINMSETMKEMVQL